MKNITYIDEIDDGSLRAILLTVISLSIIVRFATGGWLFLIGLLFLPNYLVIGSLHYFFHSRALRSTQRISISLLILIAVSHTLFVAAFLLQFDIGDGPGWFTITKVLGLQGGYEGTFWEEYGILTNTLAFIPVAISWVVVNRRRAL